MFSQNAGFCPRPFHHVPPLAFSLPFCVFNEKSRTPPRTPSPTLKVTSKAESDASTPSSSQLKFGINAILSKDTPSYKKTPSPENKVATPTRRYSIRAPPYSPEIPNSYMFDPFHFSQTQANPNPHYNMPASGPSVLPLHHAFSLLNNMRGKPRRGMLRRAVFSDSQRKGLEDTFQKQKYISKPDRKNLAEKLGLKDSQVNK
ncbi:DgyrCDS7290 [Dimorphilus gyrociliatus]|uniref:DgyrCDS7290 n=1 Tax=Dimorphilus gyrociliatus TaxID=2664684 RepID=A0A7I8VQU1_9ANNE|nr:DgyrCDS7290 [Dimorphilus gyrociliatus]